MSEFHQNEKDQPIRDVQDLASATECTGLIPAAVEDESEADQYARLYAIHRQKVDTVTRREKH